MENILLQTDRLYNSIVQEMNRLIKEEVIVTDQQGYIVASTDAKRIGNYHEGACIAMQHKEKMIMSKELTKKLHGVREGVVFPIVINKIPLGVLGITGNPSIVEPYARLVQKVTELFIQDSLTRINQESKARDVEFFIFDWLNQTSSYTSLVERSKFFHINMEAYKQVVVFKRKELLTGFSYHRFEKLKSAWDDFVGALFVRWGQDRIVMLVEAVEASLLDHCLRKWIAAVYQELDEHLYAGVGNIVEPEHLSASFSQAVKASEHADGTNPVVFEADLRFEMLEHEISAQTKETFICRTLKELVKEEELMKTLASWFSHDMQMQVTANTLHIHKNTLHYRLNRIAEITNLNLKKLDDVMLLYMAFRLSSCKYNKG
ncbi:sugar diacid recognition domain-containing protein [Virgibacillus sp. Bac330]|uniref:CdaR family transcriptional regulator n=1 Tax=Virgibacillus sp. Bac330 TaxID=2419841 RepID=UPI000EF4441C|nr:sugar diacid recognition domain-containing protein [Virgibacillus sp. Bac330]